MSGKDVEAIDTIPQPGWIPGPLNSQDAGENFESSEPWQSLASKPNSTTSIPWWSEQPGGLADRNLYCLPRARAPSSLEKHVR